MSTPQPCPLGSRGSALQPCLSHLVLQQGPSLLTLPATEELKEGLCRLSTSTSKPCASSTQTDLNTLRHTFSPFSAGAGLLLELENPLQALLMIDQAQHLLVQLESSADCSLLLNPDCTF